jgi:hypothetical protein
MAVSSTSCTADSVAFERLAATLPLAFNVGDDFPFRLLINRDLTGYTLAATIVNASTGATAATFAITTTLTTVAGVTNTRVNLSLTDTQTATLVPPTQYRWSFRWTTPTGDTRTILSGRVRAVRR